jgi:hypothetical protein
VRVARLVALHAIDSVRVAPKHNAILAKPGKFGSLDHRVSVVTYSINFSPKSKSKTKTKSKSKSKTYTKTKTKANLPTILIAFPSMRVKLQSEMCNRSVSLAVIVPAN